MMSRSRWAVPATERQTESSTGASLRGGPRALDAAAALPPVQLVGPSVSGNTCLTTGQRRLRVWAMQPLDICAENPAAMLYHTQRLLWGFSVHARGLHA